MFIEEEVFICPACGGRVKPELDDTDRPMEFHRSCWLGWPSELQREYLV